MPAKKTSPHSEANSETLNTADSALSFEDALQQLEQIVTRLESGDLPLEAALSAFESGIQLARQGQLQLQQAEQRVQILLSDEPDAALSPFAQGTTTPNSKPL
ncbi:MULTISPECIES: exodeoxyribonuclease VII small subunit [Symbiopectobacterium]|uniref:exodeoxyribonuclease VII small subunit n=1 Tax=Symbiopectobacterium TaxID=801 RepID=UPI001A35175B|nr:MULTISPECIES: exodeoxyribonuclease VII small subunit [Symbiopectobacterium]MBG6247399.1 exodeoxyribonuclease VII small subunit [Candidatus Symbiopectobacterium sp. PLON1]MBT9429569.1 exodeoxyribonuclease VII small subunit [Candidatus Symbiopectobacterium endolongispinus]